jgi:hypothetical protein
VPGTRCALVDIRGGAAPYAKPLRATSITEYTEIWEGYACRTAGDCLAVFVLEYVATALSVQHCIIAIQQTIGTEDFRLLGNCSNVTLANSRKSAPVEPQAR